jgi:hypothetical protein
MNRASDATCAYCGNKDDTAKYTIFKCANWNEHRLSMSHFIGGRGPLPSEVEEQLCGPRKTIPIYTLVV